MLHRQLLSYASLDNDRLIGVGWGKNGVQGLLKVRYIFFLLTREINLVLLNKS